MDREVKNTQNSLMSTILLGMLALAISLALPIQAHSMKEVVIRVGLLQQDYPPLFWIEEDKGIVKDILKAVSENSRFRFEFSYYPFNRLINKVVSNELDMETWTSPVWRTKYKQHTYFTNPISEHCEVTVFRKGESIKASSPAVFIGKRIGVVQNFTFPIFEPFFDEGSIHRADASNEQGVLKMLAHKRTDLALMDQTVFEHLTSNETQDIFEIGSLFDCVPVSFMFHKNQEHHGKEIDIVLQKLKRKGIIDKIINKYW